MIMAKATHPKIVIVGRPNVGKSSLFNRIVGSRKAIVEPASGTTRDRLYADIRWKGKAFTVVDTGGFEPAGRGDMAALVLKQLNAAIKEADIIFFVTDASAGIMPQDTDFSTSLRKASKTIYLVANKADDASRAANTAEFFELGLGEPYAVSAMNGTGIERLLDDVSKRAGKNAPAEEGSAVKVAIVGRPNVGKSSYLNSVFMEERVIVHPVAGTTRDAVDTDFNYKGRDYVLIDTAGMRHNAAINRSADFYGTVRSKEAVKRSDVALVMLDGFDGLREDDQRIINFIIAEGRALVIAVNKWDLAKNIETAAYKEMLMKKLSLIRNFPVIFMSCKTRKNVLASLDAAWDAYGRFKAAVPPSELAALLRSLNGSGEIKSKRMKFIYLVQEGVRPPGFALGIRNARAVNENLKRYVENFFRRHLDFTGVPIRINIKVKKPSSGGGAA
jgi:GTP-binding protein